MDYLVVHTKAIMVVLVLTELKTAIDGKESVIS